MVTIWASRVVNKCFTSQITSFLLQIKVRLLLKVIFVINWNTVGVDGDAFGRSVRARLLYFADLPQTSARPFRTSALPKTVPGCCWCRLTGWIDARTGENESPSPSAALPVLSYLLQRQVRNRLLSTNKETDVVMTRWVFREALEKSWAVTDETNCDTTNPGRRGRRRGSESTANCSSRQVKTAFTAAHLTTV